jgi:hypothetical protein
MLPTRPTEAEMEEKHEEVKRKRKIDKKSSMSFLTKSKRELPAPEQAEGALSVCECATSDWCVRCITGEYRLINSRNVYYARHLLITPFPPPKWHAITHSNE